MTSDLPLRLVVATRVAREDFMTQTATGRSLALYLPSTPNLDLRLHDRNSRGLSEVYNTEIERSRDDPAVMVFVHDDVHLCDFWWPVHLMAGLEHFQLVGVCGNRRRFPRQPTWGANETCDAWDTSGNLSGVVGVGHAFPPKALVQFGEPCQPVKLLDGMFLASLSETFISNDIRFEESLRFHFYDQDICRQFEQKGLSMGTWAISTIHETEGRVGTPDWNDAYAKYLQKWGD